MTRLLMLAAAFAATLFATPALAGTNSNFTGVRAELNAGLDDLNNTPDTSDINYGAAVGIDVPLGDRLTLGAEGTVANVFENDRLLGVGARVGLALSPNVLAFASAGYENYRDATFNRDLDGLRVGGGLELALGAHAYVKAEGRYSDLSADAGRIGGLIGVGLRF